MTNSYVTPYSTSSEITVSPAPPSNPGRGNLWIDTTGFFLYLYDGGRWVGLTDDGNQNAIAFMQDVAPTTTEEGGIVPGTLWFDTELLELKILYLDEGGAHWISCTNNGLNFRAASEERAELKIEQAILLDQINEIEEVLKTYI